jgi:hypothetical protein
MKKVLLVVGIAIVLTSAFVWGRKREVAKCYDLIVVGVTEDTVRSMLDSDEDLSGDTLVPQRNGRTHVREWRFYENLIIDVIRVEFDEDSKVVDKQLVHGSWSLFGAHRTNRPCAQGRTR